MGFWCSYPALLESGGDEEHGEFALPGRKQGVWFRWINDRFSSQKEQTQNSSSSEDLWCTVIILLLGLCISMGAGTRPNFLVLFVDDLGYNEINLHPASRPRAGGYSGYGGRVQTPALAALAEEGMVFENWYSGWHLCSPSRAACLTGRLPPRTGIDSVGSSVLTSAAVGGLPLNETTFAEVLNASGYRTGMIGKVRRCCLRRLVSVPLVLTPAIAVAPRRSLEVLAQQSRLWRVFWCPLFR